MEAQTNINSANLQNHHNQPPIRRVPRPLGLTHKALTSKPEDMAYEVTTHYLQGTFPRPGTSLTVQQFQALYKIPASIIRKATSDLFAISPASLMSKGTESLERALSILAEPQAKASRLTSFLENQVYSKGKAPGHLLIQNLIGSINLERQSADSIVKFIAQALSSDIVQDAQNEGLLSIEEAINLISEQNLQSLPEPLEGKHRDTGVKDLTPLEEAIEADPGIPNVQANISKEVTHKKLPRVDSEYKKLKDTKKPKGIKPPPILPM